MVITDLDRENSTIRSMSRADAIDDGSIEMLAANVAASFFWFCTSGFARIGAGAGGSALR